MATVFAVCVAGFADTVYKAKMAKNLYSKGAKIHHDEGNKSELKE